MSLEMIEEVISDPEKLLECSRLFHVVEPRITDFLMEEFFAREYRKNALYRDQKS